MKHGRPLWVIVCNDTGVPLTDFVYTSRAMAEAMHVRARVNTHVEEYIPRPRRRRRKARKQ